MKKLLCLQIIVVMLCIVSCATTSVYYDTNKKYEVIEIDYPNSVILGNKIIKFMDYTLVLKKEIDNSKISDRTERSSFSTLIKNTYDFYSGETYISTVDIIREAKGAELGSTKNVFYCAGTSSYFQLHGSNQETIKIAINNSAKDIIVDNDTGHNLLIESINKSVQNDKVHQLFNNVLSGVRIIINNEEYAIIDFMTEPRILFNKSFNMELNEEYKQYVVLIMLSLYEYNRTIENRSIIN